MDLSQPFSSTFARGATISNGCVEYLAYTCNPMNVLPLEVPSSSIWLRFDCCSTSCCVGYKKLLYDFCSFEFHTDCPDIRSDKCDTSRIFYSPYLFFLYFRNDTTARPLQLYCNESTVDTR